GSGCTLGDATGVRGTEEAPSLTPRQPSIVPRGSMVCDERNEGPSANLDRPAIGQQFAAAADALEAAELDGCGRAGHSVHSGRLQRSASGVFTTNQSGTKTPQPRPSHDHDPLAPKGSAL